MKKKDSKKIKENPVMVDTKNVKDIKINNSSEDSNEIKTFIIIVVIIAILAGIIYGVTELIKKDDSEDNASITVGVVNYEKVSVGTMLNRPYDEYYVLVYNSNDESAVLYSTILTKYTQNSDDEDYVKAYFCDLGNSLNSKYYDVNKDGKSNKNAQKVEDFDFGDLTLIKIKNGKVTSYIEDYQKIKEILVVK